MIALTISKLDGPLKITNQGDGTLRVEGVSKRSEIEDFNTQTAKVVSRETWPPPPMGMIGRLVDDRLLYGGPQSAYQPELDLSKPQSEVENQAAKEALVNGLKDFPLTWPPEWIPRPASTLPTAAQAVDLLKSIRKYLEEYPIISCNAGKKLQEVVDSLTKVG